MDATTTFNNAVSAALSGTGTVLVIGSCYFETAPGKQNSLGQQFSVIIPVIAPLEVDGTAGGASLIFTQPGNFIDAALQNSASFTIKNVTLTRGANSAGSNSFSGTALFVQSAVNNSAFAGHAYINNVYVNFAGSTGWQVGIEVGDLADSTLDTVKVQNQTFGTTQTQGFPPASSVAGLPSPNNPIATPSQFGPGVADDILIEGRPQPPNSSSGDPAIDTRLSNITTAGGLVGVDAVDFQGVYVDNSSFIGGAYGIRGENQANDIFPDELITMSNSETNTVIGGAYLDGVTNSQMTGNLFLYESDQQVYSAIWLNNSEGSSITGNSILGGNYGIYISATNSANGGQPVSITGNNLEYVDQSGTTGAGISNDSFSNALTVTGNTESPAAVTPSLDPTGLNNYEGNSFPATGPSTIPPAVVSGQSGIDFSGTNSHSAAEIVVGAIGGNGGGTLTLVPSSGALPAFSSGVDTIYGEVTCQGTAHIASWRVEGHYRMQNSQLVAGAFSSTVEPDSDSQYGANDSNDPIKLQLNPSAPGIQAVVGSNDYIVWSCTGDIHQLISN